MPREFEEELQQCGSYMEKAAEEESFVKETFVKQQGAHFWLPYFR